MLPEHRTHTTAQHSHVSCLSRGKIPQGLHHGHHGIVELGAHLWQVGSGIDVIIPCGTAVQNARTVEALNVDNEMTRDGTHINLYAGRYLLACTFFESIIAPCLNRNLRDDTTTYGKSEDIGQVNNQNRRLLQNCARLAVAHNYDISEFAGQ